MSGRIALVVNLVIVVAAALGGGSARQSRAASSPFELQVGESQPGPSAGQVARDFDEWSTGVSAATVFGPDDRFIVQDTAREFWRTMTLIIMYDKDNSPTGFCSGVFIEFNVILTAAHCIYHSGSYVPSVRAAPGATALGPTFGFANSAKFAVPKGYIDGIGKNPPGGLVPPDPYDWGLVYIAGDPFQGRLAPYPVLAHAEDDFFEASSTKVATVGFPGDKVFGSMWEAESDEYLVDETFLYTRVDIFSGQSGSPIFAESGKDLFIFSVVSGGNAFYNRSVRFVPAVLDALKAFCKDLGCSIKTYLWKDGPPVQIPAQMPFRARAILLSRD